MPSITGISISRRTISTCSFSKKFSAFSPLAAVPVTLIPGISRRVLESIPRIAAESSTRRSRIDLFSRSVVVDGSPDGEGRGFGCSSVFLFVSRVRPRRFSRAISSVGVNGFARKSVAPSRIAASTLAFVESVEIITTGRFLYCWLRRIRPSNSNPSISGM